MSTGGETLAREIGTAVSVIIVMALSSWWTWRAAPGPAVLKAAFVVSSMLLGVFYLLLSVDVVNGRGPALAALAAAAVFFVTGIWLCAVCFAESRNKR